MSTVMRPSGPLPPRVYWVRRVATVAVIVVVTAVVWWLVSGSGDAQPSVQTSELPSGIDITRDRQPANPSNAPRQPNETTARPTKAPPATLPPATTPPTQTPSKTPAQPTKTALAQPTGRCDPTEVDMSIDVSDVGAGRPNTATFVLSSVGAPACTLSITPDDLVVKVTSGAETIWTSDDCPDELLARQIVVRTDPPTAYEFSWNGQRSAEGCQPDSRTIEPGGYWVEAAFIGGEPHKAFFDIR